MFVAFICLSGSFSDLVKNILNSNNYKCKNKNPNNFLILPIISYYYVRMFVYMRGNCCFSTNFCAYFLPQTSKYINDMNIVNRFARCSALVLRFKVLYL